MFCRIKKSAYICNVKTKKQWLPSLVDSPEGSKKHNARIAQLVEHDLAKVGVASSSLVSRSIRKGCPDGGIGRHAGLKIQWLHGRAGSSPAPGTEKASIVRLKLFLCPKLSTQISKSKIVQIDKRRTYSRKVINIELA